jgi:transcriptional regulator with XRE-family HTH domain
MEKKLLGKHIGALVRQRRKALELTQEALEAASGIPQGTISRIEREEVEDILVSTLMGLAEALDMTPTDLLMQTSPKMRTKASPKAKPKAAAPKRTRTPAKAVKG